MAARLRARAEAVEDHDQAGYLALQAQMLGSGAGELEDQALAIDPPRGKA